MNDLTFAYLAGAMDLDGYFSIKRSTYHQRVRKDATNAVYSEKCGLKQVTPQVPELLKACFGGCFVFEKSASENRKPMYGWQGTDKVAANLCKELLPYLRIKHAQAERLLELRHTKDNTEYQQYSYWFAQEYPHWQDMELITTKEAAEILGYIHTGSISQAIRNKTLLSIPYNNVAIERPRVPKLLAEIVAKSQSGKKAQTMPPQLVAWRHRLHDEIRELNKNGVNGTPIYFRTGPYTPAE